VKSDGQSSGAVIDIERVSDRLGVKAIASEKEIPLLFDRFDVVTPQILV
jgi:hypothetical protein